MIKLSKRTKDLTGKKFGRLTVVAPVKRDLKGKIFWLCDCACKRQTLVRVDRLTSCKTSSCGCLQLELARKLRDKVFIRYREMNHTLAGFATEEK